MGTPLTFFEKVWNDHVIADLGENTALLSIDRLFLHEMSGSVAVRQLEASGRPPAHPEQVFTVIDHVIDTVPGRGDEDSARAEGVDMIRAARRGSRKYGFNFFDVHDRRQGIVHVISPELGIALPGLTLVCGDSHTCTVGGVGALAWGIGSSEGEHVLATQTLPQVKPQAMRVNFEGKLAEGRLTICNMAIEFSAKYGFIPPDETTIEYLAGREYAPKGKVWDEAVRFWRTLPSHPCAAFAKEATIDCTSIGPQVTWGTSPQQVGPIDGRIPDPSTESDPAIRGLLERALDYIQLKPGTQLEGIPIDVAYIGSCTNARISDLRIAAGILKGRKIAPGIKGLCVPGSTQVKAAAEAEGLDTLFKEAGFEWHESGCALCGHMGNDRLENQRVISTTNRNFESRQGPQTRTHLASPATVAASALAGRIADARKVLS